MGVEIEVHEGGWESEEQSERERERRERKGREKGMCLLTRLHSASNKPQVQEA